MEKQKIIGKWVPVNGECFKYSREPFEVVSKEQAKGFNSTEGRGFEGVKANGTDYHVFTAYWRWEAYQ